MFRELHDAFLNTTSYDVEAKLGMLVSLIEGKWEEQAKETKLRKLNLKSEDPQLEYVASVLKDASVQESVAWCQVLQNAINQHRYVKSKDWTMKELDVTLLE